MYLTLFFIALVIPNWTVPTLIGIAASGVFSYWLGRRFRSQSRLAFQKNDFTVVGHTNSTKSLGSIKILFNDVDVPRVIVTRLAVWNVGNTTVDGSQLATSAPLAFSVEAGALILAWQVVRATNDANKCRLRIADSTRVFIEFDYLNEQDGALFQVTHTSAENTAKLTGSIKGVAKGVEDWGNLRLWEEEQSRNLKPIAYMVGAGLVLLFLAWLKELLAPKYPILNTISDWVGTVFGFLFFLMVLIGISAALYQAVQTRSRTIPKSLSRS